MLFSLTLTKTTFNADSAALLIDEVLPHQPMRQWVLSVPFPLRFLFANNPIAMTRVLAIVYRTIATHNIAQRVGCYLERQDLLERDTGNIYLPHPESCGCFR